MPFEASGVPSALGVPFARGCGARRAHLYVASRRRRCYGLAPSCVFRSACGSRGLLGPGLLIGICSMAIYHLSAQIISRKEGRSAVAAAAYRAGENLYDERIGKVFDYTRKQGVEYSEILAPPEAPSWVHDRQSLWNAVERAEKRKDAQLAREIEIGLPRELSKDQQVSLLREFVKTTFVSQGMVADVA